MKQWELKCITDQGAPVPVLHNHARAAIVSELRGRPVFLWSADAALRLRAVTSAATRLIGLPVSRCEGRGLIEVFGMEGPNLALLEAHVTALGGRAATFVLEGTRETVRCRVTPTLDDMDRVNGVICLAVEVQNVDLRDIQEVIAG